MNVLLHTIALEPARWVAQKVSQPLEKLLPAIARAGFRRLEVFEPHLALASNEEALPELFAADGLEPVILSSYLTVNPAVRDDAQFDQDAQALKARVARFGFKQVRLFPGAGVKPTDETAIAVVQTRIATLAKALPATRFLLETHDGSIADEPGRIIRLVRELALPNVGLLYQPTVFEREPAASQFALQAPYIRHLHLQNRAPGNRHQFLPLSEGAVAWREIVAACGPEIEATLEFIPSAICPMDAFDLEKSLAEAAAETKFIENI